MHITHIRIENYYNIRVILCQIYQVQPLQLQYLSSLYRQANKDEPLAKLQHIDTQQQLLNANLENELEVVANIDKLYSHTTILQLFYTPVSLKN